MGYIWNPVKEDILRLKSLFYSLSKTFKEQKIDDELRKKSEELLETLDEMVDTFEKRYKVDDEEKQQERSALELKKQPERSVLELKKHQRSVLELKKHERSVLELKKHERNVLGLKKHERSVLQLRKHERSVLELKKHEWSVLELKKHERIVLELWLEELQEAVFNTEDLVAKIHTEALRHKLDGQVSEKMEDIRRCIECYVKAGHVLGLAGKTSYGLYKQQIDKLMEKYGHNDPKGQQRQRGPIKQPLESQRQPLDPTDYIYLVDESEAFGMYCDKEEIINLLLSNDANYKQLFVIFILGNGVIRKTTLARLVYNEQRVSHHFDRKAWVDVPYDFNWETQSILKFLTSQYNLKNKYQLQNYLKGKRFLLVLDGEKPIPSSSRWKDLQSAFENVANGSRIILTTGNEVIASMKYPVRTYRMKPLSEEKCWPIFAKFAFGDQNPTSDRQLEVIGKGIVRMCHGLPSSVKILGSLLRFKLQQEEWEAILKRLKPSSDLRENVKVVHNIRPPEDLKRCLAYCSIFPQDYEIEKEKLFLLCMAEGFLKPQRITLRGARNIFINELEPFFQKSSCNKSSFRMRMNNLADYVFTRYCFRLEDSHPSQIPLNTRYLSLVGGKYENSVIFEAIDRAKLLRTFLPLDHESRHLCAAELQNLLSKLQFLRVLSLSHYHITEIPDSIGNLEHLRYIDLSHTPIKRLPESVCELCNLQSLILSNCHSLTELPENTSKLENLLNLDISGSGLSEMPIGISKLKNLQLLPCFVVGKKNGSALTVLKDFSDLQGTLHISKLQNVTCEDGVDNLYFTRRHYLEELVLEWDDNTADPENARKVLAGLKPYTYSTLERLTINFYCGTKFPEWFGGTLLGEIVFLRLSNCKNCSTLPSLGKLPKLKVLIIECMDAVEEVGPDFSAETSTTKNTEFESLERLTFEGMSKWTKWVPLNVLPCLQQLCIWRCPKLMGNLPKELPSVERVEISESQELVTALTTEASLNNLHYREKIVFISDDKVTSCTSEGAAGTEESRKSEPETHSKFEKASEIEGTKVELSGTEESEESEQKTHLEAETVSETEGRKLEQEKSTKEDPSPSLFSEEKSLLGTTQDIVESTLPLSQTPNFREKAHDSTNTWSNQDGPQYLSFKSMKVSGLLQLIELPEGLHSLRIEGCDALEEIPEGIMAGLNQLQHLYIINCCSLNSLPEDHPPTALKKLYVQNCKKLEIFSPTKKTRPYAFLEHLCIGSSDSLISLPLDFFPNLRSLSIWDCANLQSLSMPVEIQKDLTSLEALEIRDCPKLEYFLKGGLSASNLMSIWLSNCKNLKKLPDQLDTLINSLRSLFINNCPELISLPKLPSSLSLLSITFCYKLELKMDWGLQSLRNLSRLEIEGGCKTVKFFPEIGLLPSNLNSLCVSGLSNLIQLKCEELRRLTALKTLEISCCNKLQPFTEEDLPSSLSVLCIKECSLLKPKLLNKRKMFD